MPMLWAVFIIGPDVMVPVHHARPVVHQTESQCIIEMEWLLETQRIVIEDKKYSLKCIEVPDLRGEPV